MNKELRIKKFKWCIDGELYDELLYAKEILIPESMIID